MKLDFKRTRAFLSTPGMKDMTMACLFLILAQVFPANHHSDDWFNGVASGFCTGIAFALVVTALKRSQASKKRPSSDSEPQ